MGMWPLYRESLLQGPSHVSLAIPGVPSNISKSVGGTQPALLLFPNLDFLQSFIKGNVGIGDGVLKGAFLSNMNALAGSAAIPSVPSAPSIPSATIPSIPSAPNVPTGSIPPGAKVPDAPKLPDVPNIPNPPNIPKVPNSTEMGLKMFIKSTELDIPDLDKYKVNGQIKIPASDIQLPPQYDYIGLKAMEKTIMTSIFETQKPYMDIAKVIISSMVKVEDIIARVMPLLSTNPLTSKSEKPIGKDGSSNGTKAIGYQNGLEIKKILAELEKLSKIGGALTVNKDGTTSKEKKPSNSSSDNPNPSDKDAVAQGKEWRIISTFYSTGDFDPTIEYLYTYNILPSDDEGVNNLTPEVVVEPDNPFDKYKPKKIILGLFNADGTPLNPNGLLKTKIGDNSEDKVDSKYKKADWVFGSPKWHFKPNEYIWPSFGGSNGQPIYLWEGPLGATQESKTSPGNSWSIKKYKEGDENKLNKLDAIEDDPIIVRFDASDTGEYIKYFTEFTILQTNMSKDLDQAEKNAIVVDIMSKLDVQSHLQNVFLYGSGNSSFYKAPDIPIGLKKSFKPYQIYVSEAAKDPNLSGDGLIWVDPEADYEFKVIRVDVYPDADYEKNITKMNIYKIFNRDQKRTMESRSKRELNSYPAMNTLKYIKPSKPCYDEKEGRTWLALNSFGKSKSETKSVPLDKKLYNRLKNKVKARSKVWPSAYASGQLVRLYKQKGGKYKKVKKVKRSRFGSLNRWFAEKWVNVCKPKGRSYEKCGRKKSKKSGYPYCRPLKRINKNTPTTVGELSKKKLKSMCSKKHKNPYKKSYLKN